MENTILKQIGIYCDNLHFGSLPAEVVHQAKHHLIDSVACAFGAYSIPDVLPIGVATKVAKALGRSVESTILVSGEQSSMDLAAMVNSVMVRYLDFNDTFFGTAWFIHPSDNISTALAVAERQRVSGKDFLTAMVLGYEIQQRFANLPVSEAPWYRGWDPNTSLSYSTAAVAAKLLGLGADGIANALALAASRGNTLTQIRRGQIAMDKALSIGQIAAASILAALMAQYGGTGCSTLIEGDFGFNKAVLGGCDVSSLTKGYDEFLILRSAIKPYPVEYMTIGMMDAALMLRAQHSIRPEEIQEIRVGVFPEALTKPSHDPEKLVPQTREAADHSFHWNIAKVLIDGEMTIKQCSQNPLEDERIPKLIEKVNLVVDEELSKLFRKDPTLVPIWMEITTPRGTFTHRVTCPSGHWKNPLTDDEVVAKLQATASWALKDGELERLAEATWALECVNDVRDEYIPLLVASKI